MTCIKKICIKLNEKRKHKNITFNINEINFISKIKKILKIMIIIISLILTIIFVRFCYCNFKIYKLNKKIKDDTFKTLNCFYYNLDEILQNTKKINSVSLTLSQTININQILKFSANAINNNIILNKNGILTEDGYIGIYIYIYDNFSIKKCLNKIIPLNYFFKNNEGKLEENIFNINNYSIELINNLQNIFYNQ